MENLTLIYLNQQAELLGAVPNSSLSFAGIVVILLFLGLAQF